MEVMVNTCLAIKASKDIKGLKLCFYYNKSMFASCILCKKITSTGVRNSCSYANIAVALLS